MLFFVNRIVFDVLFKLHLYVYAREDLNESEINRRISPEKQSETKKRIIIIIQTISARLKRKTVRF